MKKILIIFLTFNLVANCAQYKARTSLNSLPDVLLHYIAHNFGFTDSSNSEQIYNSFRSLLDLRTVNKRFASLINTSFIKKLIEKNKMLMRYSDDSGRTVLCHAYLNADFQVEELITNARIWRKYPKKLKLAYLLSTISGGLYTTRVSLNEEQTNRVNQEIIKLLKNDFKNECSHVEVGSGCFLSLLSYIAQYSTLNSVALWLIKNGSNVNTIDIFGKTPLYYAALECNTELIQPLINAGANFNYQISYKFNNAQKTILNGTLTELGYHDNYKNFDINKRKPAVKILIINGARIPYDYVKFHDHWYPEEIKMKIQDAQLYKKVKDEIVLEYKEKLKQLATTQQVHNDKIKKYLEMNDDEFLKNILEIRLELSEITHGKYNSLKNFQENGFFLIQ